MGRSSRSSEKVGLPVPIEVRPDGHSGIPTCRAHGIRFVSYGSPCCGPAVRGACLGDWCRINPVIPYGPYGEILICVGMPNDGGATYSRNGVKSIGITRPEYHIFELQRPGRTARRPFHIQIGGGGVQDEEVQKIHGVFVEVDHVGPKIQDVRGLSQIGIQIHLCPCSFPKGDVIIIPLNGDDIKSGVQVQGLSGGTVCPSVEGLIRSGRRGEGLFNGFISEVAGSREDRNPCVDRIVYSLGPYIIFIERLVYILNIVHNYVAARKP